MASGICAVDDASCTHGVADVDHFGVLAFESLFDGFPDWCVCLHAQAYKTIIKWKFLFLSIVFNQEGMWIYFHKKDVPVTKQKRETRPSQKNLNDKNARRYLIRLANINFGKGDIWATFGWNDDCLPDSEERARKDIQNFIKRINRHRKKAGLENAKYIYILAMDGYKRPHFHILLSGDGVDRDELEELWGKCDRPNTRRIKPDDDFLIRALFIICLIHWTRLFTLSVGTKMWKTLPC